MRVGISANRIHQSTPTEAMLAAADETGFVLQPETPIRGVWVPDQPLYLQSVAELARATRAHPSVWSYSVMNEASVSAVAPLIDAVRRVDATRPLVWNDDKLSEPTRINGTESGGHAYAMLHYRDIGCDRAHEFRGGICESSAILTGLGECAWCIENGMEGFSSIAATARRFGIAYTSGWDWCAPELCFVRNLCLSRGLDLTPPSHRSIGSTTGATF